MNNKLTWLRTLLVINLILSVWFILVNLQNGIWFLIVILSALVSVIIFLLTYFHKRFKLKLPAMRIPGFLSWTVATTLTVIASILPFTTSLQIFFHQSGRFLFIFWMAGLGSLIINHNERKDPPVFAFLFQILLAGTLYKIGSFLPEIQATPFSLTWSEGSRFYQASTFLARRFYGIKVPLSVLDPSRHMLLAIPLLLGSGNILSLRIWQTLLWIVITALGSFLLVRHFKPKTTFMKAVLTLWTFLFLFQGDIQYQLTICVILIFLGYQKDKPLRTLLFVVIASFWAGLSRINWFPLPALLAVTLYVMETPIGSRKTLDYFRYPLIWCVVGGVTAYLSNRMYILLSGNPPGFFHTALNSPLLWSRLLPGPTFEMGVLIGIAMVSLPLAILVLEKLSRVGIFVDWHLSKRTLVLLGVLFIFLAGGLVVSVKIGGGGDLHNLDAFLVLWASVAIAILTGHYAFERERKALPARQSTIFVLLTCLIPVLFSVQKKGLWDFPPASTQANDVKLLQSAIDILKDQPGEVLLISERQLLTFGVLDHVTLYPGYERVFFMEMVMSNNQPYLDEFYIHLKNHDFSAILTDSINTGPLPASHPWLEEEDQWIKNVVRPILEHYQPVYNLQNGSVNLLIPEGQPVLLATLKNIQTTEK